MDDRFYNEDQNDGLNNTPKQSNGAGNPFVPGDFKTNIDSKTMNSAGNKPQKKFQVHIEDYDSFSDFPSSLPKAEMPSYTPYGQPVRKSEPKAVVSDQRPRAKTSQGASPIKKQEVKKAAPKKPSAVQKNKSFSKGIKKDVAFASSKPASKKSNAQKRETASAENKRYNFIKTMLVFCVCLIFVSLLTVTASMVALSTINDILVIDKNASHSVSVQIPAESDFEDVFAILNENGLIRQPLVTKLFCKFRHYDEVQKKDENGNVYTQKIEYEPGNYILDINAGIEANLEEIMVRKNVSKDTIRLTFPEGWSIAQIFEKIEKSEVCSAEKLYANLEIVGQQYDFIKEIEMGSGRYLKAEGYLFPDTYDFFIDENASSVLKKLFNNFQSRWSDKYTDQMKKLGLTMDEVINIAAIIQREAKDSTQMKDISSVIHNRMADPATYPTLDMNSTKDYIISLKEYNLFSDFYYDVYVNAYNTYSAHGLPPGPICNPGRAAIEAALYPSDTNYKFFCHSETGEVYYAVTASEHQKNTEKIIYGN